MRKGLVLEFWDRSEYLDMKNKAYRDYIKNLINGKLKEDFYNKDITTDSLISKNKEIKAVIAAKQNGVIAGLEEISAFLKNNGIKIIKKNEKDGATVIKSVIILEIYGYAGKILGYERTLLNILQRMSGIATLAHNTRKLINNKCFISGTRKTLFPLIDKKAISIGGGLTHRLNLNDSILIKDNHLRLLENNIEKALILATRHKKAKYIEIEVKNEKEALEAASAIKKIKSKKLFAIMFDNMEASIIKDTIKKINNIPNNNINNKNTRTTFGTNSVGNEKLKNKKIILFEASGNINEKNILKYGKTGVDVISLGFLTHSAKAFDMSLDIKA